MWTRPMPGDNKYEKIPLESLTSGQIAKTRSAIVFRAYDGFKYTSDMLRVMRSVITELVLGSGGEYEAYLLLQVKDDSKPIFTDPTVYERVVHESVPKEFWNITILWNEALWGEEYPNLPEGTRKLVVSA